MSSPNEPKLTEIKFDEPLSKHTYYQIGGPARRLVIPRSIAELDTLGAEIARTGEPYFILGKGSNVLASDQGFSGTVLKLAKLDMTVEPRDGRVFTGASVPISTLLRHAGEKGWGGFEFLSGIPGSVGGAVAMNAGTHLGETKDLVERVHYWHAGTLREATGSELKFSYRANHFLPAGAIVVAAEWALRADDPARVRSAIDETLQRRKGTQPIDLPSCGSVFKNPREHGMHAWQVIEKLGLRGHRIGGAQFSEKHANFIVNQGGAKAQDVYRLIQTAKARAKTELGIDLQEEVKYLGVFVDKKKQ
ncbi:MAG: UDP-N-acetylmuramate dehydrogenase [Bacteriovoracia bacterium]